MLRLLFIIMLSLLSFGVLAQEPEPLPSFFEPSSHDVSLYYLGEMFGNGLVPGGADTYLLSYVFEVFNAVCLNVGLVIIIFTLITGVLQTAGQGKVLGEKWSGTWLPIRTVIGIALLVPKAGTGYNLAQSLTMWMIVQGIGGADALWSRALDYFIEGGAIFAQETTSESYSTNYMNTTTLDSSYDIERQTLVNATCIAAHNESAAAAAYGKYEIYKTDDHKFVNFGNKEAWSPETGGSGGQECGYMITPEFAGDYTEEEIGLMEETYNNAFYNMARGLRSLGEFLASEEGQLAEEWESYFYETQGQAVGFIEYLHGAQSILYPGEADYNPDKDDGYDRAVKLEELKKYGWILAGNYYMTLSSLKDKLVGITLVINDYDTVKLPDQDRQTEYEAELQQAKNYWKIDNTADPHHKMTFSTWPEYYKVPGYGDLALTPAKPANQNKFSYKEVEHIESQLKQIGNMAYTGAENHTMNPVFYLEKLTGWSDTSRLQDPILHAAEYGGYLTEIAMNMIWISIASFIIFGIIAAYGVGPFALNPPSIIGGLIVILFTAPMIFGIAGFLYAQGAMLSVGLPLIPFVIFFVAALGWFAACIEMVVAAPLVAIGLVFPEANQDIMGKAEPAFMMILNLFMRPSLIIVGFITGMILTWIGVELLNAAFYLFIMDAAHIENYFFGYIVVTLTYIALLLSLVGRTFSLITDLPNKVLAAIGDRTAHQPGAEEMITGMKSGVERGVPSGAFSQGASTTERAAQMGLKQAKGMPPAVTDPNSANALNPPTK